MLLFFKKNQASPEVFCCSKASVPWSETHVQKIPEMVSKPKGTWVV